MEARRKAPDPKHDYMKSRRNAMILVQDIRRHRRSNGLKEADIWCEKQKLGMDYILVVRSNIKLTI